MENDGKPTTDGKLNPEHWRELARRIQQEMDPNKMIDLVQELLARFDEERLKKSLKPSRETRDRSGSPDA